MNADMVLGWMAPIVATLVTLAGQLWLNDKFKIAEQKRDSARADTDAKRAAEAQWRESVDKMLSEQGDALKSVAQDRIDWYSWREIVVSRMDTQDQQIMSILKGQTTQMRSDLIHRAHRYLDDLGMASVDEKDAFNDEYKDYCAICEAYGIENSFIDDLAKRVMSLPERVI